MGAKELGELALVEAFEYLDDLRVSGITNMWEASPFIERDLGWPRDDAMAALGFWMTTFDKEKPINERVALALTA